MYDPKFEWALSGPNASVIAFTMQLPTLSELQELAADVSLTEADLLAVYTQLTTDWRKGAPSMYFDRSLNMGRYLHEAKDTVSLADEKRINTWVKCSSRTYKTLHTVDTPVDAQRVRDHVYSTIRTVLDADPSRPNAPVRPDAPPVLSAATEKSMPSQTVKSQ